MTEYAQDIFFFTNNGLLYEYDGLTDDSHLYVNLRFPVAVPFVIDIEHTDPNTNSNPELIAIPKWSSNYEQRGKMIDAYNTEALNRLEAMQASGLLRISKLLMCSSNHWSLNKFGWISCGKGFPHDNSLLFSNTI